MESMISIEIGFENDTSTFSGCAVHDLGYTRHWIIFQVESMMICNLLAETEFKGKFPWTRDSSTCSSCCARASFFFMYTGASVQLHIQMRLFKGFLRVIPNLLFFSMRIRCTASYCCYKNAISCYRDLSPRWRFSGGLIQTKGARIYLSHHFRLPHFLGSWCKKKFQTNNIFKQTHTSCEL